MGQLCAITYVQGEGGVGGGATVCNHIQGEGRVGGGATVCNHGGVRGGYKGREG